MYRPSHSQSCGPYPCNGMHVHASSKSNAAMTVATGVRLADLFDYLAAYKTPLSPNGYALGSVPVWWNQVRACHNCYVSMYNLQMLGSRLHLPLFSCASALLRCRLAGGKQGKLTITVLKC